MQGLIPARAGNTVGAVCGWLLYGAHPRSRGEHEAGEQPEDMREGSSPLARGTLMRRLV